MLQLFVIVSAILVDVLEKMRVYVIMSVRLCGQPARQPAGAQTGWGPTAEVQVGLEMQKRINISI